MGTVFFKRSLPLLLAGVMLAPLPLTAWAANWVSVQSSSDAKGQVDVESLQKDDTGWSATVRSQASSDLVRDIGISPIKDKQAWFYGRMHVDCFDEDFTGTFIEGQYLDAAGQKVLKDFPAQSPEMLKVPEIAEFYGASAGGLICAAATAKCTNDSLQWPIRSTEWSKFTAECSMSVAPVEDNSTTN